MARTNESGNSLHTHRRRCRKRVRRTRWPLTLFCMCFILSAAVWALHAAKAVSVPMSPLDPTEQLEEPEIPEVPKAPEVPEPPEMPEIDPPAPDPLPEDPGTISPDDWQLLLVNRWNPIPDGYSSELTQLKQGHAVDARAYPDQQEMMDACRAAGLDPKICSSYRTQAKQQELYENKIQRLMDEGYSYERAVEEAGTVVAVPGTSEHQTGLALDIVDASYQHLDEAQEDTQVQQWLMEHSWEYGFVLRYPNGKSETTGIIYEPWHYRYVGREAAREMTELGLCLEEYVAWLSAQ